MPHPKFMTTIYHYAKCSKSRGALCLLEGKSENFTTRFYLTDPLTVEELTRIQLKLNLPVIEMVRTHETLYKDLFKGKNPSDEELLLALAQHPILLQRPIVEFSDSAVIARPPEKVLEFMD